LYIYIQDVTVTSKINKLERIQYETNQGTKPQAASFHILQSSLFTITLLFDTWN